ncbi:two-component system, sensor histidine kinase RegB [Oryzisolibacter propanilivorax]|uniref:histidine kinase n=2 Tax=Oryzisolibacter propanilivorax TaxID=1527607 RepID=A0A1G9UD13_9BURK|nr:two-component system, sensor histidine kinase RegB [Oryzisolibacter propanilivorax]
MMGGATATAFPAAMPQHKARSADTTAGLKNLQQLIQLRWLAVIGQVFTIEVAHYGLGLTLPLREMLLVVACLAAFNTVSRLRLRAAFSVRPIELLLALLVDVTVLTVQLYLSGGAGNPFIYLYLLQVTLGAVLLPSRHLWTLVAVTTLCVALLTRFHLPLPLRIDFSHGLSSPYVLGLLACFVLNAALVGVFMQRIARNLRQRDARLAAIRQRATEEEHVLRLGLLASGAAHELGTPLSTLAVILGDWRHDPQLAGDAQLQQEIAEMQAQVQRCKTIVSGILLSAGGARGEASAQTSVRRFLDELVAEWRATRSLAHFDYDNRFGQDQPMVADATLQQMVFNVLDNAREASPDWVQLVAARSADGQALCITVTDRGPGFAPGMLRQLGTPYQSSKGRPGGGLGLFLAMTVARTLGGGLHADNLEGGGARVTLTLPLSAIAL